MPRGSMRHFDVRFFRERTRLARFRLYRAHAARACTRKSLLIDPVPAAPVLPVIYSNYGRTGTENSRLSRAAPRRGLLHDWISTVSRIWRARWQLTPLSRAVSLLVIKPTLSLSPPVTSRHRAAVSGAMPGFQECMLQVETGI